MVGGVPVLKRWSIVPGFVLLWVFLTIYVLCSLSVINRRRKRSEVDLPNTGSWEDQDEYDDAD